MRSMMFSALIATVAAIPALAAERSIQLSVPGMFCASCPYVVEAAIGAVPGVLSVTTDADAKTASVRFDDAKASVEQITSASTNAGYEATVIDAAAGDS